ncbi:MAG: GNAT family N-acetyltransferase [Gammaproteobacteria bacterium]|nr:GNAT family N-acetyltransferase [Gammaproteobacteria bacterium]
MKFIIETLENIEVSDEEIFELLSQVYVQGGFTTAKVAGVVFNPALVKKRGVLFAARETATKEFSGMVIVVPPTSNAIVRAKENECEMHLLAVKPKFRGYGLGRGLVAKAIEYSSHNNWSKIVLWTQKPMKEAQKLYESFGFLHTDEMNKNGIEFLVYEK